MNDIGLTFTPLPDPPMGSNIHVAGKLFVPADDITPKEAALLAAMFAVIAASKWGCDPWPLITANKLERHFK